MKPFVRYTALFLAVIFLAGAALAWFELLHENDLLNNPKVKPATGLLVSGLMFLGVALRGWRAQRRIKQNSTGTKP